MNIILTCDRLSVQCESGVRSIEVFVNRDLLIITDFDHPSAKLASTCGCGLRPDPDPAGGPNCVMHLDAMHDVEGRAS